MSRIGIGTLLAAVVTTASQLEAQRTWLDSPREVQVIGDVDPIFGLPTIITAAHDGGFFVADRGNASVHRFDASGVELWRFGRRGGGPGEFVMVGSVSPRGDGSVEILDVEQSRVTLVDSDGQLAADLRVPGLPRRLLPSGKGFATVVPYDTGTLWVRYDEQGVPLGSSRLPAGVAFDAPIIGESFTSATSQGAAIVFRWSSRVLFLDGEMKVRGTHPGVEGLEFPGLDQRIPGVTRVDRANGTAARDVSGAGGRVLVLAGTAPEEGGRIVDIYDESSMEYIGSFTLPAPAQGIAALSDGRLATIESDFLPVVRIWEFARGG